MSDQTSGFLLYHQYHAPKKSVEREGENPRDAELESIDRMAIFPVQGPRDGLIQFLERGLSLLRNATVSSVDCKSFRDALILTYCRMMECTTLLLLYRSSHLTISSGDTRRFERSMYPFSLSTRSTTTTSFRPTRMSFWILRIRLRESSESRIMPSLAVC